MSLLWHLIKYNFIFNKMRLIFLSIVALSILIAGTYLHDNPKDIGESIIQYCMYVFFVIFTGKMNAKNNLMFDIKQVQSMPMTKSEMILVKSVADIIYYLPVAIVFLYGFSLSQTKYHLLIIYPMFFGLLTAVNIYSLNKRVDFSRMQHSSASFKNSFLYLHKYLGLGLQIVIVSIVAIVAFVAFKDQYLLQEFIFSVFIILAIFTMYSQTLKMLKDETLSYFVMKRDLFRIGWKGTVVATPMIAFHLLSTGHLDLSGFSFGKTLTEKYKEQIEKIGSIDDKKILMAIVQADEELFFKYLSQGASIPWDSEIMGGYATHLAVSSGSRAITAKLLDLKSSEVNRPGKFSAKTPIFSAVKKCNMSMLSFLIDKGANIDQQDESGITPIMYAAKEKCYGALLKLKSLNASIENKDKEGRGLFEYLGTKNGLAYILGHKDTVKRGIASSPSEN